MHNASLTLLLQAHVHGLSSKQAARLAEFEASMWKRDDIASEKAPTSATSIFMEQSIPSVSTLDQLPYLNIE